ncbi:MAG TPA: cytochrome c biogenesis protein CcsA [Thermoanaerobaculia bacterium]|nr:cytochrome c biogenesis protein CcsA [Thermoanaerobaculia bacterium]
MDRLLAYAPLVLLLAYALVVGCYGLLFFGGRRDAGRVATPALLTTLALHLAYLVAITWYWGQFPIAAVWQVLTAVAFAIALIYAFLEWLGRERSTGFWLLAQVLLFQLLAVGLSAAEPAQRETFGNPLFGIHVSFALLGYAAFAVAASYGFLFLRLYSELKRRRFTLFYGKLPPLQVLERMMNGALAVGLAALTVALLDGMLWASLLGKPGWWRDPMILLTFATWALYGGALVLRRLHRWQGRQTALASLTGLGVIVTSLLVAGVLFTGFHRVL